MLSENLYKQIFKKEKSKKNINIEAINKHLKAHDLHNKSTDVLEDVDLVLPNLRGENLDEHFRNIALDISKPYFDIAERLLTCDIPNKPKHWEYRAGWTKYTSTGWESVEFPDEEGLIVDVEVAVVHGNTPVIATAVSPTAWYSWCSKYLVDKDCVETKLSLNHLIPMESSPSDLDPFKNFKPRLFIGHNCSYDRSFMREQYFLQPSKSRFLDTMSLHIAISGLTSLQRTLFIAKKSDSKRKEVLEYEQSMHQRRSLPNFQWIKESSLNNLSDVYRLHCGGDALKKSDRDIFVKGSLQEIRDQFQELTSYCCEDVLATAKVYRALWPQFKNRFPHPVTFAGMLEMGSAYLPINENWHKYILNSEKAYNSLNGKVLEILMDEADNALKLTQEKYTNDPWLHDLNWTVKVVDEKKVNLKYKEMIKEMSSRDRAEKTRIAMKYSPLLPKRCVHMVGYPEWYRELCPKHYEVSIQKPWGPSNISTLRRITPKLLRLTWDGFPLHYSSSHGWGYLVPKEEFLLGESLEGEILEDECHFPSISALEICKETMKFSPDSKLNYEEKMIDILSKIENAEDPKEKNKLWQELKKHDMKEKNKRRKQRGSNRMPFYHQGNGPHTDVEIPGFYFFKLPHKDGPDANCGNPLSKDYIPKFEEGILRSYSGGKADRIMLFSQMCSYWKMNRERIIKDSFINNEYIGAIIPRVVTAGTVTRRAVESTWLTASNAYQDRVGSELKAMIQCPGGYHFVGADVDSQELWIASLLGDAHFQGIHGCTALAWMTLQGKKSDGTDMHSKTAQLVGISRDQAKVFNYGRIYGAGKTFAERLLRQFNHRLTKEEASKKASVMYAATKGKKLKIKDLDEDGNMRTVVEKWEGGSESEMFNKLELIACSSKPITPVLSCAITKSLEPANVVSDFMTSRINWVVQSSAVDYLHLMLVSMKWLFEKYDIKGRFSISIHDEVRYLVESESRYRAALALQITNLLVRCMFAEKVGMNDLPQSIAFFSSVDIDKCLRKEVHYDCETPSNPYGLKKGYNIDEGETLTIYELLSKTESLNNHT
ncbi:DgyrCDS9868 [Dimorphilus gyrociliatus]|uniref:DNA polymerase subunit gamma-1 n=1 Tax=Dimorphilus gyrociliatus TaxID=2664684 RepID=A0A7I8VYA1_9ANNE|nr:DgyrCDS9868 [Dimorphilus gyrociliatus]